MTKESIFKASVGDFSLCAGPPMPSFLVTSLECLLVDILLGSAQR